MRGYFTAIFEYSASRNLTVDLDNWRALSDAIIRPRVSNATELVNEQNMNSVNLYGGSREVTITINPEKDVKGFTIPIS